MLTWGVNNFNSFHFDILLCRIVLGIFYARFHILMPHYVSFIGFLTKDDIVENVKPLFYTRMRMGEFDPPDMNPYNKITMSAVLSPQHRKLAIKAAEKSFVLLKNEGNTLPLNAIYNKVAVSI